MRKAYNKIFSREDLQSVIEKEKQLGKKIVFTNGCFDILHIGHALYLSQARELGDILIVAINSDSSVKKLKGESRPINNINDRMLLISFLESVDYVTSFEETTAINTIQMIVPHYYAKGGDVVLEKVVEKECVESLGGEIVILSLSEGYSSTNIIKKIEGSDKN